MLRPGAGLPAPGQLPIRSDSPLNQTMEATSIPAGPPASQRIQALIGTYGLAVVLLALPVYYAIDDLSEQGNLTRLGENLVAGVSNGAIWALVAIGYTLVYGIVELINFAHGEIFMIGSFISASFIVTIGLTIDSATVRALLRAASDADRGDAGLRHAQRADRAGRLQTAAQRAQAGAADHRCRLLLHPAERRAALEGRQPAGRARPRQRAAHDVHDLRRHGRERRRARRSPSPSRC